MSVSLLNIASGLCAVSLTLQLNPDLKNFELNPCALKIKGINMIIIT